MKKILATLTVATAAFAFNANALEYTPYVGLDYTYSDASQDSGKYNTGTVNVGTSYNDYFGTEIFFQKSDHETTQGTKLDFQAYGLDLMGYLPLGCDQTFNLVGTVGIAHYDVDSNIMPDDNGYGYRIGAGVQYNIDEKVSVRALARHVELKEINTVDHLMEWTLGARYSF